MKMLKPEPLMAYAARFPGTKGYGAITVDMPEYAKATAKEVAGWIRAGSTVERVSDEAAKKGMLQYLAEKRARKTWMRP